MKLVSKVPNKHCSAVLRLACLLSLLCAPCSASFRGGIPTSSNGASDQCPKAGDVMQVTPLSGVTCGATTYPDLRGQITNSSFSLTLTPYLTCNEADAPCTVNGPSTQFFFRVQFTSSSGFVLKRLVIGSVIQARYAVPNIADSGTFNGIPVTHDQGDCTQSISLCVLMTFPPDGTLHDAAISVDEPLPIPYADGSMTEVDFDGVINDALFTYSCVSNCPGTYKVDFSPRNFLVVVSDSKGNLVRSGSLLVPNAPAATNDLSSNAKAISGSTYADWEDTSAALPLENVNDGSVDPSQSDPSPSCLSPDTRVFRSVWYTYIASANGTVALSTDGSRYDTFIYVFTGTPSSPTSVVCQDDSNGNPQTEVSFMAMEGKTYSILVGETPPFDSSSGSATGQRVSCSDTPCSSPTLELDNLSNPITAPLRIAGDATLSFSFSTGGTSATGATMSSPAANSTLPGSSATFQWTTGTNVGAYVLWVGSAAGRADYFNQRQGSGTSATVNDLPTTGTDVYVRLWSVTAGGWKYNDYHYIAARRLQGQVTSQ